MGGFHKGSRGVGSKIGKRPGHDLSRDRRSPEALNESQNSAGGSVENRSTAVPRHEQKIHLDYRDSREITGCWPPQPLRDLSGRQQVLRVDQCALSLDRLRRRSVWWVYSNKNSLPIVRLGTGGFKFDPARLDRWIARRSS